MASAMSDIKLSNETFFSWLDSGMQKKAEDNVNNWTRYKMREAGFTRLILPLKMAKNEDLDRQSDTDENVIVIDRESDSPAAYSVPYATLPMGIYIRTRRYRVTFARIMTPEFNKDVGQLRSYDIDIRQVFSDNSIKDMSTEEDTRFLATVDQALGGAADTTSENSGTVQWETIYGGITRDTLEDAFKILPRTPSRLEVAKVLINNLSIREVMKAGRDEMGGDHSQKLFKEGWSEQQFMGVDWIVTIKHELVPEDSMYMFSVPEFMGKFLGLEDTTLYLERKHFMLKFFSYEEVGLTIGNSNSVARADFR
jgi:hypothetical protein